VLPRSSNHLRPTLDTRAPSTEPFSLGFFYHFYAVFFFSHADESIPTFALCLRSQVGTSKALGPAGWHACPSCPVPSCTEIRFSSFSPALGYRFSGLSGARQLE
jgi:hypothetical protein